MKKLFILYKFCVLLSIGLIHSQTLNDYISAVKGDTLVVKDYYDMDNEPNSLYYVLLLDTINIPEGRVYELKANGYYPHESYLRSYLNNHKVITGPDSTALVNNKNEKSVPPLICIYPSTGGYPSGISANFDLTIKNCELVAADMSRNTWWNFIYVSKPNIHLTLENCLCEHSRFAFMMITDNSGCNITFRNCYFINLRSSTFNQSGGVFYSSANQGTLLVENCTHIMATGNMYTFYDFPFSRININHNTFINCAGNIFMNLGYQSNMSITNTIFINSNVHPYTPFPGGYPSEIPTDPDFLPIGLVNVNPYVNPDSAKNIYGSERKILLQKNLVYWDPLFADCDSILNADSVGGFAEWKPQTIIMNSRTNSMFSDDTQYPYLVSDTWKNKLPQFTDSKDLFTTQLTNLKNYVIESADTMDYAYLPEWRLINTGENKFINPDWPIPVDLSYSDPDLQTAGLGRFPLGDLNWFPEQKHAWLAQRSAEYDSIDYALSTGRMVTAVKEHNRLPVQFKLHQNYPNPFNPNTTISFSIYKANRVSLKVYNILGQEVATLIDEFMTPNIYRIRFDGSRLASGIYVARLMAGDFNKSIKLILLK